MYECWLSARPERVDWVDQEDSGVKGRSCGLGQVRSRPSEKRLEQSWHSNVLNQSQQCHSIRTTTTLITE